MARDWEESSKKEGGFFVGGGGTCLAFEEGRMENGENREWGIRGGEGWWVLGFVLGFGVWGLELDLRLPLRQVKKVISSSDIAILRNSTLWAKYLRDLSYFFFFIISLLTSTWRFRETEVKV